MGPTVRELCLESAQTSGGAAEDADDCKTPNSNAQWYALQVRHQHERRTERLLAQQGWETLAPLYRSRRQWSDRVKEVELPLFAGYIFCRFDPRDQARIEDTVGVAAIVKFNGQLAAVRDAEIEQIRLMLASRASLSPWPYLKAGDRVRVERGPLKGLEGTLLRDAEGTRLVVSVELLQRSIAAEVDPETVVPLRALAARG